MGAAGGLGDERGDWEGLDIEHGAWRGGDGCAQAWRGAQLRPDHHGHCGLA